MKINTLQEFEEITIEAYQYLVCGYTGKSQVALAEVYRQLLTLNKQLPEEKVQYLSKLLTIMEKAQQAGDMIYLADILRFEVLKLLHEQLVQDL